MTQYYVNRYQVQGPWGGGAHFINACYDFIPKLNHEVLSPDDFNARPGAIILVGIDGERTLSAEQAIMYKMYMGNCKLIARVNENDPRKGTSNVDEKWITLSNYVDGTVFVSQWMQDYFVAKGWKCQHNTVIYNGVDEQVFKSYPKLNNGKINIVAHHWSNNHLKGFDIYEEIDRFVKDNPEFTFTYIGRHTGTFSNTNIVKPLSGPELGQELGKYDVYVSASRFDPGPNHVLEALACKLPTYIHAQGGGCVEFAGQDHTFSSWHDLKQILLSKNFHNNTAIQLSDWNTCIEKYVSFVESL